MITNHPVGEQAAARLRRLVPGGAHAYSKAADQWPTTAPPLLARGQGAWVWDMDGRQYTDWFAGLTCCPLGHAHPAVTAAITAALERGTAFQLPAHAELAAAETFLEVVAPDDEMVKFAKNGSDTVDGALKLARYATGRTKVARCAEHPFFSTGDWFIGTTAASGGTHPEPAARTLDFSYNDLGSLERLFAEDGKDLAAVILEPVRFTPPDPGFFQALRRLCDRHGTLLIYDETVSGLKWRLGGAGPLTGIRPDLTCWGKGIGGGLPLSALTGGRDLMQLGDHARPQAGQPPLFLLSTTHGADTASLAAMVATVTEMAAANAIGRAHAAGAELRGMVNAILAEEGVEQSVRLAGYDCFLNIETAEPGLKALFLQEAVRAGALVRGIFYPTAAHTAEHLEQTAVAVHRAAQVCGRALTDGAGADLLPVPARRPL
ncbi:aminotransferase class III-fold pyridoxal phosphate-dependent enzyme [Streptomyces sp. CB01881]|uniref:aminotransferase class III-fold pyridoxal phosphate-dependent enzyme n=1 Tax=Streptomyces sp. CB01881 TaxID=2078691 RepID=UPI000CDC05C2|nr:aminotransferase class III-fold pyridoxal phosphate-dependent enzyme [Streptomyces sp. CB01881]AUY50420.1 glutamate-1-semialdehyde 2,1-aminomutase [Streptomyces sp. CB01881]TYC73807.1 aminotransferase class III-fold pyridoxal phosphate-dependent enzyme [Streptomyces sp. CB01881]